MDVTWLGHGCVRLKGREASVLMDPCPKSTGYAIGKQQAGIVTISHDHPEHAYTDALATPARELRAPGEYEVGGVSVTGIRLYHDSQKGAERGRNTAFVVEIDDVRVCHLGDIGHAPNQEQAANLTDIDVLVIPVGGNSTIDAAAAAAIVSQLEPKLVVPVHYATDVSTATLDPLEPFIKQMGAGAEPQPQPKLSVTRGSLPESTQVVVLDYRK